jgi:putative acetyltransferase
MALETARLLIRSLREEDLYDFLEYAVDPELCKMLGWRELTSEEAAKKHFKRLLFSKTYLTIYHKNDGKMIGHMGFGPVDHIPALAVVLDADPKMKGKRGCALSFAISKNYRRQGLITEAVLGAMDLLFKKDIYDFFNCGYLIYNEPSRILQEKLGFHYYCTHQFSRLPDGPDIIENILMKEEFYQLHSEKTRA